MDNFRKLSFHPSDNIDIFVSFWQEITNESTHLFVKELIGVANIIKDFYL